MRAEDGYRDDHGSPGALYQRLVTALVLRRSTPGDLVYFGENVLLELVAIDEVPELAESVDHRDQCLEGGTAGH